MKVDPIGFFGDRFGVGRADVERLLEAAMAGGADYADLFFEYRTSATLSLDEQLIKSSTRSVTQGVGARVLCGERTGYAFTDEITVDRIARAVATASIVARSGGSSSPVSIAAAGVEHDLYSVESSSVDGAIEGKIELLRRADDAARKFDRRIQQVEGGISDELRIIMIATSDGRLVGDVQPLIRFHVNCIANDDGNLQTGREGGGGRVGLDFYTDSNSPEAYGTEAARQAVVQLDAREAPSGTMEVVLGAGWPGILLHEAVGHGLEADFNRKKTSAFAGLIGQRVASELCTVVDDGTIPNCRGSLNVDDEGTETTRTVLIEDGILRGYMSDSLNARLLGSERTGNGRRESYRNFPMPRMTNTFMLAGKDTREDILKGVKNGLYAVQFGGGQVDITSGKFVFSASEAYLIEDGKVTAPVRGATLIGNGPDALTKVTAVGHDLELDRGIGTCGKDGQGVPVNVGMPTIRISEMTVGGTKG